MRKQQVNPLITTNSHEMILELIGWMTQNEDKNHFEEITELAHALLNADMVEHIAKEMLTIIEFKINEICEFSVGADSFGIDLENKAQKHRPSNLEYVIGQLEHYRFPSKTEFLTLLKQIKNSRNRLFHNLLSASVNTSAEMKILEIAADKFIYLWSSTNTFHADK